MKMQTIEERLENLEADVYRLLKLVDRLIEKEEND